MSTEEQGAASEGVPRGRFRRFRLIVLALVVGAGVLFVWRWWPVHVDIAYDGPVDGWPQYGHDLGGQRYSPLDQIRPDNVRYLERVWSYDTGDYSHGDGGATAFEDTPLLVEDRLVVCTPYNRVIALDPETGGALWVFDPELDRSIDYGNQFVCRGVAYRRAPASSAPGACASTIYTATNDARLIAIDLASGERCTAFGEGGEVDLTEGIGELRWRGEYQMTSPPLVVGDVVVVGSAVADNVRIDAPSGVVRAYDAVTGALRWAWDAMPQRPAGKATGEPVAASSGAQGSSGADRAAAHGYMPGTANAWAPLSADPELGLIYVPTGNASPDYWAASRGDRDRYASSIVALRARDGGVEWSYQTVHADLWDFDVPAQPSLFTYHAPDGSERPALVQPTKMGFLFVLDRATGEPLFPVEERPVPQTDVPGEVTSPTQPFPTAPPPLASTAMTAGDAWGLTPWDRSGCRERVAALRFDGMFTPPSLGGTLMFPGNAGGSNWGGVAVDPRRRIVIANTMSLAWEVRLFPKAQLDEMRERYPDAELSPQEGTPYYLMRRMLMSPLGVPCNPPPWGSLAAVSMDSGEILWQVPLGTIRDLTPLPLPIRYGVPNLGGPVITASGLVFIAATLDNYLRAFDFETGEELWKGRLPAGGQATPMTYRLRPDGKQFVVVAAGGHARGGTDLGGSVVAFALP